MIMIEERKTYSLNMHNNSLVQSSNIFIVFGEKNMHFKGYLEVSGYMWNVCLHQTKTNHNEVSYCFWHIAHFRKVGSVCFSSSI